MYSLNFDDFHAKLKVIDYSNAELKAFLPPVHPTWWPNIVAAKVGKAWVALSHCVDVVA